MYMCLLQLLYKMINGHLIPLATIIVLLGTILYFFPSCLILHCQKKKTVHFTTGTDLLQVHPQGLTCTLEVYIGYPLEIDTATDNCVSFESTDLITSKSKL